MWLVALGAACKPADDGEADDPPSKDKEPTSSSELPTSSGDGGPPIVEGDMCSTAPTAAGRLHDGTLFDAAAELAAGDGLPGLTCRFAGPDVFVRHTVEHRADVTVTAVGTGFAPTLAILSGTCTEAYGCAVGLPVTMLDVAAGTELTFAVGVDPDDPAAVAASSPEALGFRLTIATRDVLGTGTTCGLLGQGRCETGSACIPDEAGSSLCTAVPGDTCASATEIDLGAGAQVLTVDPSLPYGDAHEHGCTGARRRDRVFHVRWPTGGRLVASTTAADVGLAARGPGCAAVEALACAQPTTLGAALHVDVQGPDGAFVFVELPADDPDGGTSELGPFEVRLAIEPPSHDGG